MGLRRKPKVEKVGWPKLHHLRGVVTRAPRSPKERVLFTMNRGKQINTPCSLRPPSGKTNVTLRWNRSACGLTTHDTDCAATVDREVADADISLCNSNTAGHRALRQFDAAIQPPWYATPPPPPASPLLSSFSSRDAWSVV